MDINNILKDYNTYSSEIFYLGIYLLIGSFISLFKFKCNRPNGTFTLHGNGNETGAGNGTGTIGDDGSGPIPGPVAVSAVLHNIVTHCSQPSSQSCSQSRSRAVWTCHKFNWIRSLNTIALYPKRVLWFEMFLVFRKGSCSKFRISPVISRVLDQIGLELCQSYWLA